MGKEIAEITITQKTQQVNNAVFAITEFEATLRAFCDCCDNQATGTKAELERQGWFLGRNEQFCGFCNY